MISFLKPKKKKRKTKKRERSLELSEPHPFHDCRHYHVTLAAEFQRFCDFLLHSILLLGVHHHPAAAAAPAAALEVRPAALPKKTLQKVKPVCPKPFGTKELFYRSHPPKRPPTQVLPKKKTPRTIFPFNINPAARLPQTATGTSTDIPWLATKNCVIFKTNFLLHLNSSFHKARDSTIPITHRLAQEVGLQVATTDMIPICRPHTQTMSAQLCLRAARDPCLPTSHRPTVADQSLRHTVRRVSDQIL